MPTPLSYMAKAIVAVLMPFVVLFGSWLVEQGFDLKIDYEAVAATLVSIVTSVTVYFTRNRQPA